jgi:hypothetical protein
MVVGLTHTATGGAFVFGGTMVSTNQSGENWDLFLKIVGAMVAALGVFFTLLGLLMTAGGWGVFRRHQWGRVVTFVLALITLLWGFSIMVVNVGSAFNILYGLYLMVYGAMAIVILFKRSKEF